MGVVFDAVRVIARVIAVHRPSVDDRPSAPDKSDDNPIYAICSRSLHVERLFSFMIRYLCADDWPTLTMPRSPVVVTRRITGSAADKDPRSRVREGMALARPGAHDSRFVRKRDELGTIAQIELEQQV